MPEISQWFRIIGERPYFHFFPPKPSFFWVSYLSLSRLIFSLLKKWGNSFFQGKQPQTRRKYLQKTYLRGSLAAQWLRLLLQCRGSSWSPGQGSSTPCRDARQRMKKKKKWTSDKGLLSRIYKELLKFNSKKTTWLKIGQKDLKRYFTS